MVASVEEAKKIAVFNNKALELASKFWPGPLTMILKIRPNSLANNFNKLNDTVGIRIPNHPIALELLRLAKFPLAVTSANISGNDPNVTFNQAKNSIGEKLDFLIDGSESLIGVASAVVDITDEKNLKIIREGTVELDY
jgi:L-threonylcarbamoyladenylate synthase